jgi:hypothetical protein
MPAASPIDRLVDALTVERHRPTPPSPAELSRAASRDTWPALHTSRSDPIGDRALAELLEECEGWELRSGAITFDAAVTRATASRVKARSRRSLRVLGTDEIEAVS